VLEDLLCEEWQHVRQEQRVLLTSLTRSYPKQNRTIRCSLVVLDEGDLATTADDTSTSGGDKTDLLTARSVSPGGSGVTHVLMVTTTVRMLDGVHRNTSHDRPVTLLGVGPVVGFVGLEHGLVSSGSTSDNTDHASAATKEGLADAGRESDSGLLAVFGVTDDDGGGAGGAGEAAAVTELSLDVGDNGALRHHIDGEDVADGERGY